MVESIIFAVSYETKDTHQSRELRLQAMTDVIFNGTKKRKQGASATVTLTFENDKGV